jgi:hypothetical protein
LSNFGGIIIVSLKLTKGGDTFISILLNLKREGRVLITMEAEEQNFHEI